VRVSYPFPFLQVVVLQLLIPDPTSNM
jgi:hypothetical protein